MRNSFALNAMLVFVALFCLVLLRGIMLNPAGRNLCGWDTFAGALIPFALFGYLCYQKGLDEDSE